MLALLTHIEYDAACSHENLYFVSSEIYGEAGVGKSQLLLQVSRRTFSSCVRQALMLDSNILQLLIRAQLPITEGGLARKSVNEILFD